MKVFVCYAREDAKLAERLSQDLQKAGYDVWTDLEALRAGQRWEAEINCAIRASDVFLMLLSSQALAEGCFVAKELALAFRESPKKGADYPFVLPLRVDDSTPNDEQLTALHWIDLHRSYDIGMIDVYDELHVRRRALRPKEVRQLDDELLELLAYSWPMKEVGTTPKGDLQVVCGLRSVPLEGYKVMIPVICLHLNDHGGRSEVMQISVMNEFRRQGWVYEAPEKYAEIIKTSVSELEIYLLADTHQL